MTLDITLVDRATLQTALATLLSNELVGAGKPVQAVYDYQIGDLAGKSPVIVVTSAGSGRRNPLHSARPASLINLDVHIFVLYADPKATPAWTEENSEDCINLIERRVSEIVVEKNGDDEKQAWMFLDFNGESVIDAVVLGGKDYRYEVIPLQAQVRPG